MVVANARTSQAGKTSARARTACHRTRRRELPADSTGSLEGSAIPSAEKFSSPLESDPGKQLESAAPLSFERPSILEQAPRTLARSRRLDRRLEGRHLLVRAAKCLDK